MNGYTFSVNCSCGSTLKHVTSGKVFERADTSAIACCPACNREWQIAVHLIPMPKDPFSKSAIRMRHNRAKQKATP